MNLTGSLASRPPSNCVHNEGKPSHRVRKREWVFDTANITAWSRVLPLLQEPPLRQADCVFVRETHLLHAAVPAAQGHLRRLHLWRIADWRMRTGS